MFKIRLDCRTMNDKPIFSSISGDPKNNSMKNVFLDQWNNFLCTKNFISTYYKFVLIRLWNNKEYPDNLNIQFHRPCDYIHMLENV